MTSAPDIVVVGAGAVGAACAHELAARGASVVILERGSGWAAGCSAGNTGLIVPSHSRPLANPTMLRDGLGSVLRRDARFGLQLSPVMLPWATRYAIASMRNRSPKLANLLRGLAAESLERWKALGGDHLKRSGLLEVYASESGYAAACAAAGAYAAAGVRCELLDARAARELEPTLKEPIAGAVHFPDEHHGDPSLLVAAVGEEALERGATLRSGVSVTRLRPGGGVETSDGDIAAGAVVLAAGAAAGGFGVKLPLAAGRGCSVDVLDGIVHPRLPVMLAEGHVVASPFADRTRLAGTFDIGTPDNVRPVAARRVEAMFEGGRQLLRTTSSWSHRPVWSGSGPIAPDGMPIVGPVPGRPDVFVATGHAMLGVTLGPVTGRLVADAVDGAAPLPELAPGRFAGSNRASSRS